MPIEPKPQTEAILVKRDLEREIKGQAMLAHQMMGRSIREIAALFEMSPSAAHRWLRQAKQDEQLKRAKGIVGERLVPKALAVYDQKLQEGDLEAARDVLFGAGILTRNAKVEVKTTQDPLEAFRQRYFSPPAEVVEGEVKKDESEQE